MMQKLFIKLSIFFFFSTLCLETRSQITEIKSSKENVDGYFYKFIGAIDGFKYAIIIKENRTGREKKYSLVKFNPELKKVDSLEITSVAVEGNSAFFYDAVLFNGKITLFYDMSTLEVENIYSSSIDPSTFKFDNNLIKIREIKLRELTSLEGINFLTERKVKVSENGKFLTSYIAWSCLDVKDNQKVRYNKAFIDVYNQNLEPQWNGVYDYEFPFDSNTELILSDKGDVAISGFIGQKIIGEEAEPKELGTYDINYVVYIYNQGKNKNEIRVTEKERYVFSSKMIFVDDLLKIVGFYSKKGRDKKSYKHIDGIYYAEIKKGDDKLTNYLNNEIEFNFIAYPDQSSGKDDEDLNRKFKGLDFIIEGISANRDDGSIVLVAEKTCNYSSALGGNRIADYGKPEANSSNFQYYNGSAFVTGSSSITPVMDEILVIKLSSAGRLIHHRKIDKHNLLDKVYNFNYSGILTFIDNDVVTLVYNVNDDNKNINDASKYKSFDPYGVITSMVTRIDQNGVILTEELQVSTKTGVPRPELWHYNYCGDGTFILSSITPSRIKPTFFLITIKFK